VTSRAGAPGSGRRITVVATALAAIAVPVLITTTPAGASTTTPAGASTTTTTPPGASTTTTIPVTPAETRQAARFVRAERADSQNIQSAVETVLLELRTVAKAEKAGTATKSTVEDLTKAAQTAHDALARDQQDYRRATTGTGVIGTDERAIVSGGAGLSTAMATMVTFTHSGDDTVLARFAKQYNSGLLAWDGGIRSLWSIASAGTAPAIP
jgi:hypothetical protein